METQSAVLVLVLYGLAVAYGLVAAQAVLIRRQRGVIERQREILNEKKDGLA